MNLDKKEKPNIKELIESVQKLSKKTIQSTVEKKLPNEITHVYHPLEYGWETHKEYLERYAKKDIHAILIGINPGPFGMCQTAVPFGEVNAVRDFLKLKDIHSIGKPKKEHPKRTIEGFSCPRSEVSGRRIWHWAKNNFHTADQFFENYFIWNLCPTAFLESSGRNRTPDKLPSELRDRLVKNGIETISELIRLLKPKKIVGIGRWSADVLSRSFSEKLKVHFLLHPSPASPAANRGWEKAAIKQLADANLPTKI